MAAQVTPREYWWVYAIAGVASILFGLAALLWPGVTVGILILLFGVFTLVDGIARIIGMFRAIGARQPWWPQLLLGLISVAAGVFILTYPGVTALVLLYVIAFWAIAIGLMEIVTSLFTAQFLLLIVGALTIVFGLILLGNPIAGVLALVTVIGIFAIVRGVILLIEAVRAPTGITPAL